MRPWLFAFALVSAAACSSGDGDDETELRSLEASFHCFAADSGLADGGWFTDLDLTLAGERDTASIELPSLGCEIRASIEDDGDLVFEPQSCERETRVHEDIRGSGTWDDANLSIALESTMIRPPEAGAPGTVSECTHHYVLARVDG